MVATDPAEQRPPGTLVNWEKSSERTAYRVALFSVLAILLGILWIPKYNTLVDYPSHLARAWALHNYDSIPFFQTVFIKSAAPLPNLAIDLIVPPLLAIFPPVIAGKVFLSLIVLLFGFGCHLIASEVYGRPSWVVPLAAFAVVNSTFLYGFVNSSFGMALFLMTFGVWLRTRRRRTPAWFLGVSMLCAMTYLAHLSGFVFLVFAMAIWRLLEFSKKRGVRWADAADFVVLLPAVAIHLFPRPNKIALTDAIHWGGLTKKALGLVSVFVGFRYDLDCVAMLLVGAALVLVVWKGGVRLQPMLSLLGSAFLLAAFVCPTQLGGADAADTRFIPPAMVFLFLSLTVSAPARIGRIALSLALAGMLLKTGEIGWNLLNMSSAAERQVAALAQAHRHSRIYEIYLRPADLQTDKRVRANQHLCSYSLILTESVSSDFFAERGVQPLYFRAPSEWIAVWNPTTFDAAFLDAHLKTYDYVWGCNLDRPHYEYISRHASLVSTGDSCSLWKLAPQNPGW